MVFDFLSTPVSRAVLPRAMADGNIMMQSFAGRGDAIDGEVFKWIFPVGATYWGQVANDVQYIKDQHKGNLKGVKIGFIYPDYAFGQEPIPILKTLAAKEGFELMLFPNPLPGKDQAAVWTQVRRANPDWMISWNLSAMHVVAAREMKRNGYPMDKLIVVNWFNEADIANIGAADAKGIKRGTNVVGGKDHALMKQIATDLYGKGKGNGDVKFMDDVYYNTGLAMSSVMFEGARLAAQARRLAADPGEDQGRPGKPERLRRQRPAGTGDGDREGPRRRRQDAHRHVGRHEVGAAVGLDRRLRRRRRRGREGAVGRVREDREVKR